jgi:hypothetical protein
MRYLFILFGTIILLITSTAAFADSRLDNCLPYKEEISSILESEGVSSDYFYLAVCESSCKIKTSSKGARGFFQVMPYTFSVYKDDSCTDIDDIRCNTIAAARYIKHLQGRFKEISILVKAYNRGGTNLLRKGSTREADGLSYCVMKFLYHKKSN